MVASEPESPHAVFRRAERVLARDLGEEAVLLDLESGRYFSLNATGRRIWQALATPRTLDQLLSELTGEYHAPPEEIRLDVEDLLSRLVRARLLLQGE